MRQQPQPLKVRVVTLNRVDHPRVIASADLEIGNLFFVKGIQLVQDGPSLPLRLQGPQVAWTDDASTRHYASCCKLRKPLRQSILDAIVTALLTEGVTNEL